MNYFSRIFLFPVGCEEPYEAGMQMSWDFSLVLI